MDPILEVKGLYKVFGEDTDRAFTMISEGANKDKVFEETGLTIGVNDVSLSIKEGEIFVIMGLSGSGKSTLVRLLNRLIEPTKGNVLLRGKDIAHISEDELREVRRNNISMVFQNFALMPHMTVIENAAFGLELAGVELSKRKQSAFEALERVGLGPYSESYPDELSGGMKQRVGLARALACDPDILLMDEAFSALDPLIRTEMQDELIRLQNDDKRTIVFISHDLDEAMRIGDRIAIMQNGEVVQVGTPDEILNNPANDYVEAFFRGVNVASVLTVKDIARKKPAAVFKKSEHDGPASALQILMDNDREYGIVIDKSSLYSGIVSVDSLRQAHKENKSLVSAQLDDGLTLSPDLPINDVLGLVGGVPYSVPVVDEQGNYFGVVTKSRLLQTLDKG
ncbi:MULTISPECIES: glycine betaine/L-proline ABC transporter ATP-binding protein ProV [Vibrio]|uniref:Quaternary amine transport ATP-binding protein n=2 Tax=Vibrio cyclitrophicus TaxID=47951 RepID=A0A7Z1MFZ6_9VIBR|nr:MULTISPECIES: glycine betaine/L-proline ABC transporter ATP-binding protein ProV [Vibrio]KNH13711.1 glycine/betaine ABC transporter ATP-binding protein [Vibrio lentus]MBY7659909.1 glycine betaine/L-proline ABC transporter ATP-binding protein ProV [Vibrio atlanticus]KAA8599376.1 Glycine betaine/L-proline transport ATP-binding protein ProV [Vibrio cyclitrophicus]MBE8558968.1 glycine betaine/L-proline ABC transporter ATP-binding protein ProV [Vibrio sp. OPT24]MBE8605644.1 glycine betaine/L-pro|tara:strand:- start:3778 stop:4965 length:1188 start_codon:yes stop_codon:yes gene_type:complete